ncbi:hypothetical protein AMATHDRAFT_134132 [Amanita thiersii Skay4041]|uniref:DUF1764-domain-containing protein n=1 Tax=Amanita thiersii Skay4041 TaxID=703135 RepID=A0A2A9P1Q0_9AGAR|nr:hypothetical protein AMATHDRAFT_134132 [Amanita thiersii Skay4041]
MSEIDEIFAASKRKLNPVDPSPAFAAPQKRKRSDNPRKRSPLVTPPSDNRTPNESVPEPPSTKRPLPETVVDSSSLIQSKRSKADKSTKVNQKPKNNKSEAVTEAKFKDSRGTGPRRRTEEGWLIYKEDELGIHDDGGDTPLCPFDCNCCE